MRHIRLLAVAAALTAVVALIGATNAEARGRGHGGHHGGHARGKGHAGPQHKHAWFMLR